MVCTNLDLKYPELGDGSVHPGVVGRFQCGHWPCPPNPEESGGFAKNPQQSGSVSPVILIFLED